MEERQKKAYKRKYMDKKNEKNADFQPPTKEEFDRLLITALNTPHRKRTKRDRAS